MIHELFLYGYEAGSPTKCFGIWNIEGWFWSEVGELCMKNMIWPGFVEVFVKKEEDQGNWNAYNFSSRVCDWMIENSHL